VERLSKCAWNPQPQQGALASLYLSRLPEMADFCLSPQTVLAVFCRSWNTKRAGQIRCNGCSGRMQTGGQVECNFAADTSSISTSPLEAHLLEHGCWQTNRRAIAPLLIFTSPLGQFSISAQ